MRGSSLFILGVITGICLVFLLGAAGGDAGVGRYQVSAWGAPRGDSYRCGYFVVDTTTGKIVEEKTGQ